MVANHLSGGPGPTGVDSQALQKWINRYGVASERLRQEMCEWVEWLGNSSPSWAAYRALVAGRMVALDKNPGTRPVVSGEIWLRLIAKIIKRSCGWQCKGACGSKQLCAGLEAGIEGSLHAVREVWPEATGWTRDNGMTGDFQSPGEALLAMMETEDMEERLTIANRENATHRREFNPAAPDAEIPGVGCLLVDAKNAFNKVSCYGMLFKVR